MIVVADTTPLNYLIRMRMISILEDFYERVYLPNAVAEELRHHGAPQEVQRWAIDLPG
jgi:predicted nucleic acid-binding protein